MNFDMVRNRKPHLQHEKNRHGKWAWYVRLNRQTPRIRIHGEYGSDQFNAEYAAAVAGTPVHQPFSKPHKGSLRWLVDRWKESSDWHMTASSTKRQRENILLHVLAGNGEKPFVQITDADILAGRERRMKTPFAANNFLKTMRALFTWAKSVKLVTVNPVLEVPFLPRRTEGHEPWTIADVGSYRSKWEIGTRQRLAMEVLLWSGLRRGDAVRLGRQHLVSDDMLRIKTEKTDVVVSVKVSASLAEILKAGPTGDLAFIVGEHGRPMAKESFGTIFRQWCNAAGVSKSAHGLRKFAAIALAEAGGTEMELQAAFGWTTNSQSSVYTRNASRDKLSADGMAKREGNNFIPAPSNVIPAPIKHKGKSNA